MPPSGSKPPGRLSERQSIGLFSLLLGAVLFTLILFRGQQAAREGNQELSRDTYWVLVSPVVFAGFGVVLLRTPRGGAGRQRRQGSVPPAATPSRPAGITTPPQLRNDLSLAARQSQAAQQALAASAAEAELQLSAARSETAAALASAQAAEARREQAAERAATRISELEQLLQQSREARSRAEADLESVLTRGTGPASDALQLARTAQLNVDRIAAGLEEQLGQISQQQRQLVQSQDNQLAELRADAHQVVLAARELHRRDDTAVELLATRLTALEHQLAEAEAARLQVAADLQTALANRSQQAGAALTTAEAALARVEQIAGGLLAQRQDAQRLLEAFQQEQTTGLSSAREQAGAALVTAERIQAGSVSEQEAVAARLDEMDQQIQQAQQARQQVEGSVATELAGLQDAHAQALAAVASARQRVDQVEMVVSERVGQAREAAAKALQLNEAAQQQVDRLEQMAFAAARNDDLQPSGGRGSDPFLSSYQEACEELGVVPGSSWIVVRATWRRNLMHWHPDQGGDAARWIRRNAAYQLLAAWYEFTDDG